MLSDLENEIEITGNNKFIALIVIKKEILKLE